MRNVAHREIDPVQGRSTLGGVLFRLRARRHWTLREMSEHTGIPISTLSKVERDRATLTYDKLQQLSASLNLRMSELFGEPTYAASQNAPAPVVQDKHDFLYLR
jgi:transcriptional regulator with XRE-family HTH domain